MIPRFDLTPLFVFIGIVFLLVFIGFSIAFYTKKPIIESRKRINPEIRLTIKDNKVDTLFVYKPQN